jgi:hypothetical protein
VSSHLHEWIDLIFGCKQRSIAADNIFHPWSYSESTDADPAQLATIQQHAANFGITPARLFRSAHQPRRFRPAPHALLATSEGFLRASLCGTFAKRAIRIASAQTALLALFDDGEIAICSCTPRAAPAVTRAGQLDAAPDEATHRVLSAPARCGVVIAPRWAQTFTLFSAGRRRLTPPVAHSVPISALAIDGDFCASAASDSSIVV